jgi:hypothetical protein
MDRDFQAPVFRFIEVGALKPRWLERPVTGVVPKVGGSVMTAEELLQFLQIVELTREMPKLKAVNQACLVRLESHAEEFAKSLEEKKKEPEKKVEKEHEVERRF